MLSDLVSEKLDEIGIADGKPEWIALQLRRWQADGKPDVALRNLIASLLFEKGRAPPSYIFDSYDGPNGERYLEAARSLSQRYFSLHQKLRGTHLLSHEEARQLLSHAGLITRLAIEERMSASEICRLLVARDSRTLLNWKMVQAILADARQVPNLGLATAQAIFAADTEAEPLLLGDLTIPGAIERIGLIAESFGCTSGVASWLRALLIEEPHEPFLLILHYQLLIQAEYDHALTFAYEFSPRGQAVKWLTEQYSGAGIPVAKDAYLNNAKAVLRFDEAWVTGRSDNLKSATALARTLRAMEDLGPVAKSELASQMRGLLHRNLRLNTEANAGLLPNQLAEITAASAEKIFAVVAVRNTRTTGIVEQRIVDCFGVKRHPPVDGWTSKGIGQSVFAANVPSKKFGDAEFEFADRMQPLIRAYEAHGGLLTMPYVLDHLNSFSAVLKARMDELVSISKLENWSFEVIFIAHQFDVNLPVNQNIFGVDVTLTYISFEDVVAALDPIADRQILTENLIERLNNGNVHPSIRITVQSWIDTV
ncbi:MAG: hypothetical protein B7Y35_00315 [Sphingomonadales bacterium 28-64-96]|nr:MAG: hypothetical protein B7Y35_00315 [Sphingomonadales bacterium 28-64-96]